MKKRVGNGVAASFLANEVLNYDGDECLIWPFARNRKGYGVVRSAGKSTIVSRLVCEKTNGPAPRGFEATHKCGRGYDGCVARRHLVWGTRKDNALDRDQHSRTARGLRNGRGKLSDQDVTDIRAAAGSLSQREIANRYKVDQSTVSKIFSGQRREDG